MGQLIFKLHYYCSTNDPKEKKNIQNLETMIKKAGKSQKKKSGINWIERDVYFPLHHTELIQIF